MKGGESCLKVLARAMMDEELRVSTVLRAWTGKGRKMKDNRDQVKNVRLAGWLAGSGLHAPWQISARGKTEVVYPRGSLIIYG